MYVLEILYKKEDGNYPTIIFFYLLTCMSKMSDYIISKTDMENKQIYY